jgi:hypothetical protein
MLWVSLLAIFFNCTCFLLYCTILILSCMQEHFRLAEGVSLETTNIAFDKAVQKVINDTIKHARVISTTLYYLQVFYHPL